MSKHKHCELIKRWADDTSLVILIEDQGRWERSMYPQYPRWYKNMEYFLVPEKHAEVALHWLNGGEVERLCDKVCKEEDNYWTEFNPIIKHARFDKDYTYRIKPKAEIVKAWVGTPKKLSPDASYVVYKQKPSAPWVEEYTWTEVDVSREV